MGNHRSRHLYENDPVLMEDPETWRVRMSNVGFCDFLLHRILALPFVIIRWQCQIGAWSNESHISPLTVAPLIYRLISNYPIQAFFRGLYAVLTLNWVVADLFNAILIRLCRTGLPRFGYHYDSWNAKLRYYGQKFLDALMAGPVYAAVVQVVVQAAQSNVLYNCTYFGMLVASRYFVWELPTSEAPLMPFWIVGPLHGAYYAARLITVSNCYFEVFIWMKSYSDKRRRLAVSKGARPLKCVTGPLTVTTVEIYLYRMEATALGFIVADLFLYPMETVLNRLCIQGTGAFVDSLDSGAQAIPIAFAYSGPLYCLMDIWQTSGIVGFYRGVGCVILQGLFYAAVFGALHLALVCFETRIDRKLEALEDKARLGRMLQDQGTHSEEERMQANLDYYEQKRAEERLRGFSVHGSRLRTGV